MHCRINRREEWVLRMSLERAQAVDARFLTFTYTNEALADGRETLAYVDMQAMWRRVRHDTGPGLRFFSVGEYGSLTLRPHWHCIVCSPRALPGKSTWEKAWDLGYVDVDKREVTSSTCRYVAKYVTKDTRIDGVNVVRMSRDGAIGSVEIRRLARDLAAQGFNVVPAFINYGPKSYTLDATMKRYYSLGIEDAGLKPIPVSRIFDSRRCVTALTRLIASGVERGDEFYVRMQKHGAKAWSASQAFKLSGAALRHIRRS